MQNYALVILYSETNGKQWICTEAIDYQCPVQEFTTTMDDEYYTGEWLKITPSVNPLGFYSWQGVVCNENREIKSITLPENQLKGSIPEVLGILHKSVSKSLTI